MICSSMCLTSNSSGAGERSFSGMTSGWLTGSLSSARWLITITVPWNVFCPVFQEVDVINSEPDVLPFHPEDKIHQSPSSAQEKLALGAFQGQGSSDSRSQCILLKGY